MMAGMDVSKVDTSTDAATAVHHEVIVVGSGFGGLTAAYRLLQSGQRDFLILERAAQIGGTWRDNDYPGCACDVPSVLYSLSFAQNAEWSRTYPTQPELKAYTERVADELGLMPYVRLNTEVLAAHWDEAAGHWRLETSRGGYTARVLFSCTGPLAEPKLPDIPGLETFEGAKWHSAQWDHGVDLRGKRVASVGTGASAIQYVPAIAPTVGHLDVYQRSAPWVVPRHDRPIPGWVRALRRTRAKWLLRVLQYWRNELSVVAFAIWPRLLRWAEWLVRRHIAREVPDPALRERVVPQYRMGCKRILVSNDWYPALQRENVSLVTAAIERITPGGICTADGVEHPADVLVFGTGFYATDNPVATRVFGRGGQSLAEAWAGSEAAYKGTVVHGFPNLFLLAGPNTGIVHTSYIFMLEAQVNYAMDCLRTLGAQGAATMDVRADVQAAYNAWVQQRMQGTVWASGCRSWYMNADGKVTAIWPDWTWKFWWQLRRCDPADFSFAGVCHGDGVAAEEAALARH